MQATPAPDTRSHVRTRTPGSRLAPVALGAISLNSTHSVPPGAFPLFWLGMGHVTPRHSGLCCIVNSAHRDSL